MCYHYSGEGSFCEFGYTMGTFFHSITLIAPGNGRVRAVEWLMVAGAHLSIMPSSVLEGLGVRKLETMRLRLANGEEVEWELGEVEVKLDGRRRTTACLFGPQESYPIIGAYTLEAFALMVDPVEGQLIPKTAYLG